MKLLEIQHIGGETPIVRLATDSSIVVGGKPVFLPEISDHWEVEISRAYRISRLGKTIAKRFASRYYDAWTLVARFLPLDLIDRLGDATPLINAFDGALALGRWQPLDTPSDPSEAALHTSEVASHPSEEATHPSDAASFSDCMVFCPDREAFTRLDEDIETLSRSFILKNGDVIVSGGPLTRFLTAIDSRIDYPGLLTFNVK